MDELPSRAAASAPVPPPLPGASGGVSWGLKAAVAVMGLILAIGFGVVVATILYRIGAMEESVAAPASTTFTAPADSRLIATHPAGDGRLVLVYALAAGGHLIVFADPETEPETWQTIRLRPATSF